MPTSILYIYFILEWNTKGHLCTSICKHVYVFILHPVLVSFVTSTPDVFVVHKGLTFFLFIFFV